MKLHRALLALAVTACFATPAFAFDDDAILYNVSVTGDAVLTGGIVGVDGHVDVRSRSSAVVDQNQDTTYNWSLGEGDQAADFNGSAMEGASGNIGVNVSAGVGNAQSNDAALSAVDGNRVFASAQTFSSQYSLMNEGSAWTDSFYSAVMEDDALAGASGNIGVNVGAGVGNAQSNAMAASVNSSGRYALATSDSAQVADSNTVGTMTFDTLDLFAVLGGNALSDATGNIGVNVSSGVGNLQHNGLSIASASCGTCTP
jgi:hypothetical protein